MITAGNDVAPKGVTENAWIRSAENYFCFASFSKGILWFVESSCVIVFAMSCLDWKPC